MFSRFFFSVCLASCATTAFNGSQVISSTEWRLQGQFDLSEDCNIFSLTLAHLGYHDFGDVLLYSYRAPQVLFWEDGFTATIDFDESFDGPPFEHFVRMAESVTDGIDEPMALWGYVSGGCFQSLPGIPYIMESQVFGRPTDLVGNEIDLIRLIIANLELEQVAGAQTYDLQVAYEFWGRPIPEPRIAAVIGIATLIFRRRNSC